MFYKVFISLPDALDMMTKLEKYDIEWNGEDDPTNFDAVRAKKALKELTVYKGYIKPVRCKICMYKRKDINQDSDLKNKGFHIYDCIKNPGGYLGDDGYCSLGEVDPMEVLANMVNQSESEG